MIGSTQDEFLVAQWLEHPAGAWKVMGSNPVEDLDFFFAPRCDVMNMMNITSFSFHYRA